MTANLLWTTPGRGAWSSRGGALNLAGTGPGPYFRAPADDKDVDLRIGVRVARLVRDPKPHDIHINDYAVWRGALEVQARLRALGYPVTADGIWGPQTDSYVKDWQREIKTDWSGKPMKVDGIYGQQTARTMWQPVLVDVVDRLQGFMAHYRPVLVDLAIATVNLESGWDICAVGVTTPHDLGLSQINHQYHPSFGVDNSINPRRAFNYKMDLILQNGHRALWDWPLTIASYNGGSGGAEKWHNAGRPRGGWADRYLTGIRKQVTTDFLRDALKEYA